MRELLPDNLVLAERLETLLARVAPAKTPEQREVGSLLTWMSSFATYIAVVAQVHPDRAADMQSVLLLRLREPQVCHRKGSLSHGTKGNVYFLGCAHTSTSVCRVKPVTRPKTALLPLQTQPSSS